MPIDRLAISALLFGITLIPLQWWPGIPIPGMQVADAFFLLAALATAMAPRSERPMPAGLRPAGALAAGLVLLSAGVSTVVSGAPTAPLKLLGHAELVVIALLVGLWGAAHVDHRTRIERALVVAAAIAALTGVAGVVGFYLGWDTPLLNPHNGDLIGSGYPRVRGTTVRANQLASVVATGFVILWVRPSHLPQRWRTLALGTMATALLFTFSRTVPFVALVLALWWLTGRRRARLWWVVWAAIVAAALVMVFVLSRYEVKLDPTRPWAAELTGAPGTRWIHGREALATALAHPLWGVGPGQAPADGWSAHFTWINVWAVLGAGALVGFAGLMVLGLTRRRAVLSGPWLALLVLATDTLHRDIEDMRHLWVLFGLLALARLGTYQETPVLAAVDESEETEAEPA